MMLVRTRLYRAALRTATYVKKVLPKDQWDSIDYSSRSLDFQMRRNGRISPSQIDPFLAGPTSIIYSGSMNGEWQPNDLKGILRILQKQGTAKLIPLGGTIGEKLMDMTKFTQISKLPEQKILQGQLLGTLQGVAGRVVTTLTTAKDRIGRILESRRINLDN